MKQSIVTGCLLLIAFIIGVQRMQAQTFSQSKQEISFNSGSFKVVGDLKLPEGQGPHPVILFVHGSGPTNRTSGSGYLPLMEIMLSAGYATFAWDKPGTGASSGQLDESRLIEQRSQIVLDAIETMKSHPSIEKTRIGLFGTSQAGYIMPVVLSKSKDISFMIAVGCPGESGADQGTYLLTRKAVCAGLPEKDAKDFGKLLSAIERAQTYKQYAESKKKLISLLTVSSLTELGLSTRIKPIAEWQADDLTGLYTYYWNPMELVKKVKIPVLVLFGEKDAQADPVQGTKAYNKALKKAGNTNYRVEIIPGADHSLFLSETGCLKEQQKNSLKRYSPVYLGILKEWLKALKGNQNENLN